MPPIASPHVQKWQVRRLCLRLPEAARVRSEAKIPARRFVRVLWHTGSAQQAPVMAVSRMQCRDADAAAHMRRSTRHGDCSEGVLSRHIEAGGEYDVTLDGGSGSLHLLKERCVAHHSCRITELSARLIKPNLRNAFSVCRISSSTGEWHSDLGAANVLAIEL